MIRQTGGGIPSPRPTCKLFAVEFLNIGGLLFYANLLGIVTLQFVSFPHPPVVDAVVRYLVDTMGGTELNVEERGDIGRCGWYAEWHSPEVHEWRPQYLRT